MSGRRARDSHGRGQRPARALSEGAEADGELGRSLPGGAGMREAAGGWIAAARTAQAAVAAVDR
jgi:hypothetical protein